MLALIWDLETRIKALGCYWNSTSCCSSACSCLAPRHSLMLCGLRYPRSNSCSRLFRTLVTNWRYSPGWLIMAIGDTKRLCHRTCAVIPSELFFPSLIHNVDYSTQPNLPLSVTVGRPWHPSCYVIPVLLPTKSINRIRAVSPFVSLLLIAVIEQLPSPIWSDSRSRIGAIQPRCVTTLSHISSRDFLLQYYRVTFSLNLRWSSAISLSVIARSLEAIGAH